MANTYSGLRAVSLFCFAAAASALPNLSLHRRQTDFTSQGCYVGNYNGNRVLHAKSYAAGSMTHESCAAFCTDYKYFGIEYGSECYCGNTLVGETAPLADCSFNCPGNAAQKCGAGGRLQAFINNLYVPPAPGVVAGENYLGCFTDVGDRVLPYTLLGASDMTAQKCATHCSGYSYFGLEYGRECWCGNSPPATKFAVPESECGLSCSGDSKELCGDHSRINVWGPAPPSGYAYEGCYSDSRDGHTLTGKITRDAAMTIEKCAAACSVYPFFGLEFGSQCFCGTSIDAPGQVRAPAECSQKCGGNDEQICGASDRLSIYSSIEPKEGPQNVETVGEFNYYGCQTDDVNARSLTGKELRSDDMTVEKCAAFCEGFSYFGLEYTTECYCGNTLGGQSAPEAQCSEVCGGNPAQWCGAGNRLNVYAAPPPPPPASSSSAVPSSSSAAPSSSAVPSSSSEVPSSSVAPSSTSSTPTSSTSSEPTPSETDEVCSDDEEWVTDSDEEEEEEPSPPTPSSSLSFSAPPLPTYT